MPLTPGEPAPWFVAQTPAGVPFAFDTAAGRYALLLFLPQAGDARAAALRALKLEGFDPARLAAFVVAAAPPAPGEAEGLAWLLDGAGAIARRFAVDEPHWLLLDPGLRVLGDAALDRTGDLFALIRGLPHPAQHAGIEIPAPVLLVPNLLEPELCHALADLPIGPVDDGAVEAALRPRLERRLFPAITRAQGFTCSRIEQCVLAAYEAGDPPPAPRREAFGRGRAHRKYVVSVALNDDYRGGELRFPEFGPSGYRAPVGGGLAFSAALVHTAAPVTAGRRLALEAWLHDEAGEQVLAAARAQTAKEPA